MSMSSKYLAAAFGAVVLALALGVGAPAGVDAASQVTFTKDVLPIMQENCQNCHRPLGIGLSGMIAPMSFMNYREVRPWAKAIARAVKSKAMPPWHATDATHGVFRNERTLTDSEIDTLITWVETGAKRGNPSDAPEPIQFPETGWSIGEPDLVIEFEEPYWVADEVQDIQPRIQIHLQPGVIDESKWVSAIEFKPGSEVVHHMVGYTYLPGEEEEVTNTNRSIFGRIAPGTDAQTYPEGFGVKLEPEAVITMGMHYHKEKGPGTGAWDSSSIGVTFHEKPVIHPITSAPISYGAFEIPPHHSDWKVGAAHTFEEAIIILDFLPHMHLRGKSAKYTAYYPDGTVEVLLDVPVFDYNWQIGYEYEKFKYIPAGTRIEWEMSFDNSEERAEQAGLNAERSVRFGGPTTDEMDLGWITYSMAEENVVPLRLSEQQTPAPSTPSSSD